MFRHDMLSQIIINNFSDSSDDESPNTYNKNTSVASTYSQNQEESDNESGVEYKDVSVLHKCFVFH